MSRVYQWISDFGGLSCEVSILGVVDYVGSPATLTEKRTGLMDVEVGGPCTIVAGVGATTGETRTQDRCRVEVEGRVAGVEKASRETRAQVRCRVTVGKVG